MVVGCLLSPASRSPLEVAGEHDLTFSTSSPLTVGRLLPTTTTSSREMMRGHPSTSTFPAVRTQHGRRRNAAVHGLVRAASEQRRT
nr:hypothetical protein CFP56_08119 [Quercus suber]